MTECNESRTGTVLTLLEWVPGGWIAFGPKPKGPK
jgi:hypothetical protein